MALLNYNQTKKQTYAFIIACLLNGAFLFFIFLCELNKNALVNEHLFYEHDIVLDLLDEQSKPTLEKAENTALKNEDNEDNAGLMIRGTAEGTLPPSLFSDYQSYTQTTPDSVKKTAEQNKHEEVDDQKLADQTAKTDTEQIIKDNYQEAAQEFSSEQQSATPAITDTQPTGPTLSIASLTKKMLLPASQSKKKASQSTPSLAQITRNVLQTTQQARIQSTGNAAIFMSGDPNKLPSELQLIEEYYWTRMEKAWTNSFTLLQDQLPDISHHMITAVVQLVYQPDGYIKNVRMIRSSGNSNVDEFIMNVFNDALPNFPSKPSRLRKPGNDIRQCTIYLRLS